VLVTATAAKFVGVAGGWVVVAPAVSTRTELLNPLSPIALVATTRYS